MRHVCGAAEIFRSNSFDHMEGLSVHYTPDGETVSTLVSDDNFLPCNAPSFCNSLPSINKRRLRDVVALASALAALDCAKAKKDGRAVPTRSEPSS
jgi:hypothetical protein